MNDVETELEEKEKDKEADKDADKTKKGRRKAGGRRREGQWVESSGLPSSSSLMVSVISGFGVALIAGVLELYVRQHLSEMGHGLVDNSV